MDGLSIKVVDELRAEVYLESKSMGQNFLVEMKELMLMDPLV